MGSRSVAAAACFFLALSLAARGEDVKAPSSLYWIDSDSRLMWAAADNGSGVSWSQAKRYCRESSLGGFRDWTLPSIEELQKLFGGPGNGSGYHVKGPIKLTGWQWSSTAGQQEGEGWALDFGDGTSLRRCRGFRFESGALCPASCEVINVQ